MAVFNSSLVVDGMPVQVTRKKIKNMYIRVLPPDGRVHLSAPGNFPDAVLRRFVLSGIAWIKKQKQKFAEQVRQAESQYLSGESCPVWGREYCLEVICPAARNSVYISGEKLVLQMRGESTLEQRKKAVVEWYREQIKLALPRVLGKCEQAVGVRAAEWRIKDMRTRWGSCNPKQKRIWLNLQLAKKNPECLEYVVVHELVHFLEQKHSSRFRELMDTFHPCWRSVKSRLNSRSG